MLLECVSQYLLDNNKSLIICTFLLFHVKITIVCSLCATWCCVLIFLQRGFNCFEVQFRVNIFYLSTNNNYLVRPASYRQPPANNSYSDSFSFNLKKIPPSPSFLPMFLQLQVKCAPEKDALCVKWLCNRDKNLFSYYVEFI